MRTIEIAQPEKQKINNKTTNKQSLRDVWVNKKRHTHTKHIIHITEVPERVWSQKKKKNLKEIMVAENFSNLMKDPTDPRSWANPKHGKFKEIYIKIHRQKSEKFRDKEN